jgi:hypothetical protein
MIDKPIPLIIIVEIIDRNRTIFINKTPIEIFYQEYGY